MPPGVEVNKEGYVIEKTEVHNKLNEINQDLIKISQDLAKNYQTKETHPKGFGELKELTEKKIPELKRAYNYENQKKEELIEDRTDTLKRLQAEFENYKKRIEKEKTEFVKYAQADVVAGMLPILDSFEIALKNTADREKFVEGIKIIYAQFYSALEAEGLRPINTTGEKFDPYRHEVLLKEESGKPEGTIIEEFQKGYMLYDKVLRFSKVKVSGK